MDMAFVGWTGCYEYPYRRCQVRARRIWYVLSSRLCLIRDEGRVNKGIDR